MSVYADTWFRAHSETVVEIQHDVRHSLSPGPVLPVVVCMLRTETLKDPCTAVDTFYSDISVPQSFWTYGSYTTFLSFCIYRLFTLKKQIFPIVTASHVYNCTPAAMSDDVLC